jgi:putative transcriptional regulator
MNPEQRSNRALLEELGHRIRRARLNRNLTQAELAKQAGISRGALQKAEEGGAMTTETMLNILRGLSLLSQLEQFLPEPPPSPVQLAKLQGEVRQRASGKRKKKQPSKPATAWTWKE